MIISYKCYDLTKEERPSEETCKKCQFFVGGITGCKYLYPLECKEHCENCLVKFECYTQKKEKDGIIITHLTTWLKCITNTNDFTINNCYSMGYNGLIYRIKSASR